MLIIVLLKHKHDVVLCRRKEGVLGVYDTRITGGRLYIDQKWSEQNLYLSKGKIALISSEQIDTRHVYDAKGAYIVPGLIDSHVHLASLGKSIPADDFYTGGIAAATGGVTTMIDFLSEAHMPDEVRSNFEARMADASKSLIDYSFHCGVRQPENFPEIARICLELGMPSIKLYTTYRDNGIFSDDKHVCEILKRTSEKDIMALCHTENDNLLYPEIKDIKKYSERRPAICEISEAIKLAEMVQYFDGKMYMVHVSCGSSVEALKKRFSDILNTSFILESCPHYFIFDDNVFSGEDAKLYTMTPPLRSADERKKLIENVDVIYTIGTDHCPFNSSLKQVDIDDIPMGVGGLGYSFAAMYGLFGDKIIDAFTLNQAKAHGLYPKKGVLAVGSDADITIFEDIEPTCCEDVRGKCDYSIYTGLEETIRIRTVFRRGEIIVQDGKVIGKSGGGCYQKRKL